MLKVVEAVISVSQIASSVLVVSALTHVSVLSTEQAGDGRGSAEPHAVCGVPGLSARGQRRRAAAVRGCGRTGRETHEEEELQMGLTDRTSLH